MRYFYVSRNLGKLQRVSALDAADAAGRIARRKQKTMRGYDDLIVTDGDGVWFFTYNTLPSTGFYKDFTLTEKPGMAKVYLGLMRGEVDRRGLNK